MLQLQNVNAFYGRIQVLREVSLQVSEGEIVAVIGPERSGQDDAAQRDLRDRPATQRADRLRRTADHGGSAPNGSYASD